VTVRNAILELRGVAKTFPTAVGPRTVLRDVNLSVFPGDFIVLTGPSGSGKTTLLHIAALLESVSAGEICFDGIPVSGLSEKSRCEVRKKKIGMVFQRFFLLPHRTAIENVAFRFRYLGSNLTSARAQAEELLVSLGMGSVAETKARLLSGGEMHRVALARALVVPPRLLLADEPTGNLDAAAAAHVAGIFREQNRRGVTILLATHNESWLKEGNRHWCCDQGTLREVR
jgi:putative ABC transport system ATP-binding protein